MMTPSSVEHVQVRVVLANRSRNTMTVIRLREGRSFLVRLTRSAWATSVSAMKVCACNWPYSQSLFAARVWITFFFFHTSSFGENSISVFSSVSGSSSSGTCVTMSTSHAWSCCGRHLIAIPHQSGTKSRQASESARATALGPRRLIWSTNCRVEDVDDRPVRLRPASRVPRPGSARGASASVPVLAGGFVVSRRALIWGSIVEGT